MNAIDEYYAALERLKANKPTVLPKSSAINNDTVALEAGRKRGSIKKSRHVALVEAIEQAKNRTKAAKSDYEQLQEDYEKLLQKCNSLLLENFELKQKTHL